MKKAPLREPTGPEKVISSRLTAERCSWMRSENSALNCSPSCFAYWNSAKSADPADFAEFQYAKQLGLQLRAEFSDLIQEQRSAVSLLEMTFSGPVGSRKSAFFMTEQFSFGEAFRQDRAVHIDEGASGAPARVMNGAGHEFLSRSGFALNQDAQVRRRNQIDRFAQLLDRFADAQQRLRGGTHTAAFLAFFLSSSRRATSWWALRILSHSKHSDIKARVLVPAPRQSISEAGVWPVNQLRSVIAKGKAKELR